MKLRYDIETVRMERHGVPEVIYCMGKDGEYMVASISLLSVNVARFDF